MLVKCANTTWVACRFAHDLLIHIVILMFCLDNFITNGLKVFCLKPWRMERFARTWFPNLIALKLWLSHKRFHNWTVESQCWSSLMLPSSISWSILIHMRWHQFTFGNMSGIHQLCRCKGENEMITAEIIPCKWRYIKRGNVFVVVDYVTLIYLCIIVLACYNVYLSSTWHRLVDNAMAQVLKQMIMKLARWIGFSPHFHPESWKLKIMFDSASNIFQSWFFFVQCRRGSYKVDV